MKIIIKNWFKCRVYQRNILTWLYIVFTGTWSCVAHRASIRGYPVRSTDTERKEKLHRLVMERAGRWNEIKRGEATRLKGKAGPTPNRTASVGCSRRHLYSREIVIDRSENPNGFVAPFLPFFISCTLPLERNETAREHRHLSCQGFRRNILAHTRCESQSGSVTIIQAQIFRGADQWYSAVFPCNLF